MTFLLSYIDTSDYECPLDNVRSSWSSVTFCMNISPQTHTIYPKKNLSVNRLFYLRHPFTSNTIRMVIIIVPTMAHPNTTNTKAKVSQGWIINVQINSRINTMVKNDLITFISLTYQTELIYSHPHPVLGGLL